MKTQECTTRSPIEVMLPKWAYQCDHQIKARGGVCEASQNNLGSGHESFETISGDYRSELHVKSRVMQGKDANGKQVYDEAETHIRYLGPCKADMKSGDTFLVGEDGRLTKQR